MDIKFEVVQAPASSLIPIGNGRAYEVREVDLDADPFNDDAAEVVESDLNRADAERLAQALAFDHDRLTALLEQRAQGDTSNYRVRRAP